MFDVTSRPFGELLEQSWTTQDAYDAVLERPVLIAREGEDWKDWEVRVADEIRSQEGDARDIWNAACLARSIRKSQDDFPLLTKVMRIFVPDFPNDGRVFYADAGAPEDPNILLKGGIICHRKAYGEIYEKLVSKEWIADQHRLSGAT